MPKYTIELRQLLETQINIFDFEYTRLPEAQAILSDEQIEQGFKDHFNFREIGHETPERFKFQLKVQWRESMFKFDRLLIAFAKDMDLTSTNILESDDVKVDNDTPKNALDFGTESNHASYIGHYKNRSKGRTGTTEISLIEDYYDKLHDIETEFYDSFDNLFMQLY